MGNVGTQRSSAAGLTPNYDQITQTGLDLQYTAGAWLWKLEAIRRGGHGLDFWAATGGFEWTLPGGLGGGTDLGLLAEYSHDGRAPALAPTTIFDNDLFLGARLSLGDIDGSTLLAGALIDMETDARVFIVEDQQRLGDDWQISVEGRFFSGARPTDPIRVFRNEDFLSISVKRFF